MNDSSPAPVNVDVFDGTNAYSKGDRVVVSAPHWQGDTATGTIGAVSVRSGAATGWYVVVFDDGANVSVHHSSIVGRDTTR